LRCGSKKGAKKSSKLGKGKGVQKYNLQKKKEEDNKKKKLGASKRGKG
jgi:ribosomal protein L28